MRCCCGKYELEDGEPLNVNDKVHEVLGPEGNFCGPRDHHVIRDQEVEIKALKAEMEELVGEAEERANKLACENADLKSKVERYMREYVHQDLLLDEQDKLAAVTQEADALRAEVKELKAKVSEYSNQ